MKCPKCNYVSFDWLDKCQSCNKDLTEFKEKFGIWSLKLAEIDFLFIPKEETKIQDVSDQKNLVKPETTEAQPLKEAVSSLKEPRQIPHEEEHEMQEFGMITIDDEPSEGTEETQEDEDTSLSFDLDLPELDSGELEEREEIREDVGKVETKDQVPALQLEGLPGAVDSGNEEPLITIELEDSLGQYSKIEDHLEEEMAIPLQSGLDFVTQDLGDDLVEKVETKGTQVKKDQKEVKTKNLQGDLLDLQIDLEKPEMERQELPRGPEKGQTPAKSEESLMEIEDDLLSLDLGDELKKLTSNEKIGDESSELTQEDSSTSDDEDQEEGKEVPTFELNLDDLNLEDLNLDDLEESEDEKGPEK